MKPLTPRQIKALQSLAKQDPERTLCQWIERFLIWDKTPKGGICSLYLEMLLWGEL